MSTTATRCLLLLAGPIVVLAAVRDPSVLRPPTESKKTTATALVRPDDWFQFKPTVRSKDPKVGDSYGPKDWNNIHCNDIDTCPGYPTNWKRLNPFIPYNETMNMCIDCSMGSVKGACAKNNQSPIGLKKNVTATRICYDRHRMNFVPGNTRFGDVDFQILPHALRAYQPETSVWPSIDFSWGFPFPWLLRFVDVTVPSQHTIDRKRYSAEIILSHTSSKNYTDLLIGNVAILVEVGEEKDFYPFFELYLREWEAVAAKVARNCFSGQHIRRALDGDAFNGTVPMTESELQHSNCTSVRRRLGDGTQVINRPYYNGPYYPHMFVKDAPSEYYFRYQGSVIEPPCLEYVHWRVLRLPITISSSQFKRLNAIFIQRLNPVTCKRESAGRVRNGKIKRDVRRPIQTTTNDHKLVYCECVNWRSAKPKDVAYCNQTADDRGVLPFGGSGS